MMYTLPITLNTLLLTAAASIGTFPADPVATGIDWKHGSFDAALQGSKQQSGLTMVYFWADGSEFSGKLYTETLSKPRASKAVEGVVCYNAKHSTTTAKLFERYKVRTLPTMLFVRSNGEPEDIITGFIPLDDFTDEVARIKRGEATHSGLVAQLAKLDAASEEGVDARWSLVGKLGELGLNDQAQEHTDKIRELDPDGNTTPGGQLKLNDLTQEVFDKLAGLKDAEFAEALRKADFGPVYALAKSSKSRVTRFNTWSSLARIEARRDDFSAAKVAVVKSVAEVADENRASWCISVAGWVVNNEERVSSKERKYALVLAKKSVELTRALRKKVKGAEGKIVEAEQPKISDYELSDDALAQRICVLAQVQFMNRDRKKARKSIAEATSLAKSEQLKKVVADVAHRINSDQ